MVLTFPRWFSCKTGETIRVHPGESWTMLMLFALPIGTIRSDLGGIRTVIDHFGYPAPPAAELMINYKLIRQDPHWRSFERELRLAGMAFNPEASRWILSAMEDFTLSVNLARSNYPPAAHQLCFERLLRPKRRTGLEARFASIAHEELGFDVATDDAPPLDLEVWVSARRV